MHTLSAKTPSRREIVQNWNPEDASFWDACGKKIANQNLYVSTWSLTLSFVAWTLWATVAAQLNAIGFHLSDQQIFTLASLPGLVGATCRLFYTYMPGIIGGKTWTWIATAIMLVPVIGLGQAIQNPATSYETLVLLVSLIGVAGGNFSSSMANIGNFFPRSRKGTALGINGGIGNLGVSLIYLVTPFAISLAALGNLLGSPQTTSAGKELYLQMACYVWVIPILITLWLILRYMDNLPAVTQSPREVIALLSKKHTWVLTWIYTCGFGSFIGYSVALALLVNKEFPEISFTYAAFIGPLISALCRSFGGWWADKIDSGASITFYALILMLLSSLGVLFFIHAHQFTFFFICFLLLFLATGLVNGATFRMMPIVFKDPKQSSLITGFTAAIAAYGAFIIPKIFGWSYATFSSVDTAFYILMMYTSLTIGLTYYYYHRKNAEIKC